MTPVLLVQGTHGWGRTTAIQWWESCSPFCAFLQANDFAVLGGDRPYLWDTDLDGIGWLGKRPAKKHINWQAAAWSAYNYLVPALVRDGFITDNYVPIAARNVIGHSHAMQVMAYACSFGLKINRLVTIGSPVREDMMDVYKAAKPNIGRWLHVHSDGSDRIQWFGELLDGHLGIVREQPYADENKLVAKVSHSKLLNDEKSFPLWRSAGLLDFLAGSEEPHADNPFHR